MNEADLLYHLTLLICYVIYIKDHHHHYAQSCLTLCDPIDQPIRLLHPWDFPAIVLEWIAISFSRGSSQPRARTRVSRIVDRRFTVWATREAPPLIPKPINPEPTLPTTYFIKLLYIKPVSPCLNSPQRQILDNWRWPLQPRAPAIIQTIQS